MSSVIRRGREKRCFGAEEGGRGGRGESSFSEGFSLIYALRMLLAHGSKAVRPSSIARFQRHRHANTERTELHLRTVAPQLWTLLRPLVYPLC